jgi:hypothetical protein
MPGQDGFKYVYSVGHIDEVLAKIRDTGRPDKLTVAYMQKTWLLKNAQYTAVLDLLKDMDFIDSASVPTSLYAEYQNPALSGSALAKGVRKAYAPLFKAYPNAPTLSKDVLDGYIKQHTGAEVSVITKISSTIRRLCSLADFSEVRETSQTDAKQREDTKAEKPTMPIVPISMNIQIVIPNDASADQYDKIFSSIKKFLMK